MEKLYGLNFLENGDLRFLVEYRGVQHLLTAKAADLKEMVERQEITVVVNIASIVLQKAADYNRANSKYRVTIITVEDQGRIDRKQLTFYTEKVLCAENCTQLF